ncbi:MAG: BppU family phage baseplate upper protein [Candidatus Bathyarchaeia archaeon]
MSLSVKRGNYGFALTFNVKNSDGSAKNLTGYTVTLKVWASGSESCKFTGTCTVTDAANGICTYTVANGDFATVGQYLAELELTKTGVVEDTETFPILVEATAP